MQKESKDSTIASLLTAVQRNNGYMLTVNSVKEVHGIVYVTLDKPYRTVKMTSEAYGKIKEYIVVNKV